MPRTKRQETSLGKRTMVVALIASSSFGIKEPFPQFTGTSSALPRTTGSIKGEEISSASLWSISNLGR